MKLIIVRHGETEWNKQDRAIGQLDSPLTAKGIQQAYAIANCLRRFSFTTLYSSDLGRAVQTANIIAEICGKNVIVDSELREWNMGIFQGLTFSEMDEKFPQQRQDHKRMRDEFLIPEGESLRQCRDRGYRALNRIAEAHLDETVGVITHGFVLMNFCEMVLNLPPGNTRGFKVAEHASLCSFEYINGCWSLVSWNDVSHLENMEILTGSLNS